MNKRLTYIFLFSLLIVFTSCTKTSSTPFVLPTGNFSGSFTVIHLHVATGKLDTAKSNIILSLSTASGYKVTGDTTIHAGSYGTYAADGNYIQFVDKTVTSTTTKLAKYHLYGTYSYNYDGTNLQFSGNTDTLGFTYILKATQ